MKKVVLLAVVVGLAAPAALADDLNPPEWRGQPNSTFQHWSFDSDLSDGAGSWAPDVAENPFGAPDFYDYSLGTWTDGYEGRTGVYQLDSEYDFELIEINLPNSPEPNPVKWVRIQVVSHWDGEVLEPDVYIGGDEWEITDSEIYPLDPEDQFGWIYSRWDISIYPNPEFEEIDLYSFNGYPLIIDQIVVDTICIPEPGTMGLLSLAGLALLRRR